MKITKTLAWCIIVCMLMTVAAPILAYANTGTPVITYNGTTIIPEIKPYENELGLMVSAEDMAKAFSIEFDFNSRMKYFHMITEEYGDIFLMHNATRFVSGENEFGCAPNFYFENGIPMVEVGFFCEMFGAEYKMHGSEIVIGNKVDSLPINNLEASGGVSATASKVNEGYLSGTIKYRSGAPKGGLEVDIILAAYVNNSFYDTFHASTVTLGEGVTTKSFNINVREVLSNNLGSYYKHNAATYAVYYSIPSLGLTGVYNNDESTYALNEDVSGMTISTSMRFRANTGNSMTFDIFPKTTVSGTISFDRAVSAPKSGLDVELYLTAVSDIRTTNYGQIYRDYSYYPEYLGTVHFDGGEKSKEYSFSIPDPENFDAYPYYFIHYSSEDTDCILQYAYLSQTGDMEMLYSSYYCPNDVKVFNFDYNSTANLKLPTQPEYGVPVTGKCGDNARWILDKETGILTIKGKGAMYDKLYFAQWRDYINDVTKIVIENGITSIGYRAFYGMENVESVSLPESLRKIDYEAFGDNASLTEITLPSQLTEIGYRAFAWCSSLKTVTIPDSIIASKAGNSVFNYCSSLETIYAPAKLKKYESIWKGVGTYPQVIYDCNVVFKKNGQIIKTEDIEPGTVIDAPEKPEIPEGGLYLLTVNGKEYTEPTITVSDNMIINETVILPTSTIKNTVECTQMEWVESGNTFGYSCNIATTSQEPVSGTAIVALYDSTGRLIGIERKEVSGNTLEGTLQADDKVESYKILILDDETLDPTSFICEGHV